MADESKSDEPLYDYVDELNDLRSGFNRTMELTFVRVTTEEVVARVPIGHQHLQPYGLVHGGVYAGIIETVCSTGAAINALARGQSTVGLDNNTSFLRAVRSGTLTVTAVPLVRGRRSHVWEAKVTDDDGRVAAAGRVRLLCLEPGDVAGGEAVKLKTGTLK